MASFGDIALTSREAELFGIFRDTIAFKQRQTVARVAGGWVRDKLLGKESDDIDVALDDQMGLEFANSVNEYLETQGVVARRVGVIEANPEQSKHLETATTHVLDLSIDFVNLRAETYSDSRIPETRFGSPLEDALRRDFTINALFYNIQTSSVEDLSGHGLSDLAASVLRTPMDPFVTFKDDPLRVLRAVRFAARFNLAIDARLWAAASDPEVHAGLRSKVSRERMLKEFEGCLCGSSCRPVRALDTMHRLGLSDIVFMLPPAVEVDASAGLACSFDGSDSRRSKFLPREYAGASAHDLLRHWTGHSLACAWWAGFLLAMQRRGLDTGDSMTVAELLAPWLSGGSSAAAAVADSVGQASRPTLPPHVRLLFWSSAMAGLDWVSFPDKKGRALVRVGGLVMRDMLKVDNDTCRDVRLLLDGSEAFASLCEHQRQGGSTCPPSRLSCGLVVRAAKELWRAALWLACTRELASAHGAPVSEHGPTPEPNTLLQLSADQAGVVRSYRALEVHVSDVLHLDGCWAVRPLFDGQSLQRELGTFVFP